MTRSQHVPRKNGQPPTVPEKFRAVWHSDLDGPIKSAGDFARAMNCDVARVAKTILLIANTLMWQGQRLVENPCACVVLSSPDKVDLIAVSQHLAADGLRLATVLEVQKVLGVQPGSISPFVAGRVPVLFDVALLEYKTVFVNGGQPGLDLEIDPRELLDFVTGCSGQFAISGT